MNLLFFWKNLMGFIFKFSKIHEFYPLFCISILTLILQIFCYTWTTWTVKLSIMNSVLYKKNYLRIASYGNNNVYVYIYSIIFLSIFLFFFNYVFLPTLGGRIIFFYLIFSLHLPISRTKYLMSPITVLNKYECYVIYVPRWMIHIPCKFFYSHPFNCTCHLSSLKTLFLNFCWSSWAGQWRYFNVKTGFSTAYNSVIDILIFKTF